MRLQILAEDNKLSPIDEVDTLSGDFDARLSALHNKLEEICKRLKASQAGLAVLQQGDAPITAEVSALLGSLHPIQFLLLLKKGSEGIRERAKGVLINTLWIVKRTQNLMRSATYCEERAWLLTFLTRQAGQEYSPWDQLPLPPLSEQIRENNLPLEISKEVVRRVQLINDRDQWHKIVKEILKLPFALDTDGILLPGVYQGITAIDEASVCFLP